MVVSRDNSGVRDGQAAGLMSVTVLFFSLSPLLIVFSGASSLPFLFGAVMQVGGLAGYLVLLSARYCGLLSQRSIRDVIWCHLLDFRRAGTLLFLGTLSCLDYALFIYSTRFIDISVATVLFEMWPLVSIPLTAALAGKHGRYARITPTTMLLLGGGFAGAAFVMVSQTGHFRGYGMGSTSDLALGFSLAVLSAVSVALSVCLFRWSEDLVDRLPEHVKAGRSRLNLEIFAVAVSIVVADCFAVALNGVIGIATGEALGLVHLGVGIVAGLLMYTLGSVAWRAANFVTLDLGINALGYFTPLVALVWLWVYSNTGLPGHDSILAVARPEFLVIGAAAVVSFNLLINLDAERLLGPKALVVSLWAGGAVVFLWDADRWTWPGSVVDYFGALVLSAIVFTLILSFRVARLVRRTRYEDNRRLSLVGNIDALRRRSLASGNVSTRVSDVGANDGQELPTFAESARGYFADATEQPSGQDAGPSIAVEGELDAFAHLRQQVINFGEGCALILFAGITVGLMLFFRPSSAGLAGFLIDMLAIVFCSVVVCLMVNVMGSQRNRRARVLDGRESSFGWGVLFQNDARRVVERWISPATGLLILCSYAVLLAGKWMCGAQESMGGCASWWGGLWLLFGGH